jgi:hypothetical protein
MDLSKAYDCVNWTFLQLVLIELGMNLKMVNWIMGSLTSASFVVLMNEYPSCFFRASRGLCQVYPLSPFLFLIIAEAFNRLLKEDRHEGWSLRGLKVMETKSISHLLFVDNIWVSIYGSLSDVSSLKKTLDLFCKETSMKINLEKSCLLTSLCSGEK